MASEEEIKEIEDQILRELLLKSDNESVKDIRSEALIITKLAHGDELDLRVKGHFAEIRKRRRNEKLTQRMVHEKLRVQQAMMKGQLNEQKERIKESRPSDKPSWSEIFGKWF